MKKLRCGRLLRLIVAALLASLLLAAAGCSSNTAQSSGKHGQDPPVQTDNTTLEDTEIVVRSTHIIEAEYVGRDPEGEEFFRPLRVIKGDAGEKNELWVTAVSEPCEKGETYLLFLEKNISVYYEHDKYVSLGDHMISQQSDSWGAYQQLIRDCLRDGDGSADVSYYGVPYIDSSDVAAVAEFSSNIFVVEVENVYGQSSGNPTAVYSCSVVKTIRNTPVTIDSSHILITLFNGTVSIGEQYVVLLGDAADTAPVYTLSSKGASLYAIRDAEAIPVLNELLSQAKDYPAGN